MNQKREEIAIAVENVSKVYKLYDKPMDRMFEALGYYVEKLDRVSFAGLTKKDLPRGRCRFLTEKEINFLKML